MIWSEQYSDILLTLLTRPVRLGLVSRLYPELTAQYLTDSLMNVFYMDNKSNNKFRSIDSMYFEWEVNQAAWYRLRFDLINSNINWKNL